MNRWQRADPRAEAPGVFAEIDLAWVQRARKAAKRTIIPKIVDTPAAPTEHVKPLRIPDPSESSANESDPESKVADILSDIDDE